MNQTGIKTGYSDSVQTEWLEALFSRKNQLARSAIIESDLILL
ncbi:6326_t:CDS:2 [Diversispora eburnea]|uniref:6326_t:CDS:1 n=1 Tax=Diversispora eburnea TaxID=1213867 RepID=A0A9N9FDK3_9GLOM|nr:6326_t:CDS:2 [Diversispora eburnea]